MYMLNSKSDEASSGQRITAAFSVRICSHERTDSDRSARK